MTGRFRHAGLAALFLALASVGSQAADAFAFSRAAVRLPSVAPVTFRGVVNHDAAGLGTGQMLYPAPNIGGLLIAILTHSAITEGAKKAQKEKIQAEADAVLDPLRPVLPTLTHELVLDRSIAASRNAQRLRLIGSEATADGDPVIEMAPVYAMTPDRRALVLDNVVRILDGDGKAVRYAQTVRVVSRPLAALPAEGESAPQLANVWLESDGQRLHEVTTELLAEAIDVAIAEAEGTPALITPAPTQRTIRYPEGGSERMERAELIEERCGRLLIRTLRGWLMSVPSTAATACAEGAR